MWSQFFRPPPDIRPPPPAVHHFLPMPLESVRPGHKGYHDPLLFTWIFHTNGQFSDPRYPGCRKWPHLASSGSSRFVQRLHGCSRGSGKMRLKMAPRVLEYVHCPDETDGFFDGITRLLPQPLQRQRHGHTHTQSTESTFLRCTFQELCRTLHTEKGKERERERVPTANERQDTGRFSMRRGVRWADLRALPEPFPHIRPTAA